MRALRGVVVGCGMVSEHHLAAWRRISEVDIVALVDVDQQRAEHRRESFAPGAKTYARLADLLGRQPLDFVDVLTPPMLHAEQCLQAKVHGLHIICQKPLCESLESAVQLAGSFAGYDKLFVVHENHRLRPWFCELLRLSSAGVLGDIRQIRLEHHTGLPVEAYKLSSNRGVWLEYGIHLVDMMRAILGEPEEVRARIMRDEPNICGESRAVAAFQFQNAEAVVDVAWTKSGRHIGALEVIGTSGEAVYHGSMTRGESAELTIQLSGRPTMTRRIDPDAEYRDSFYRLQQNFVHSMLTGEPAPQSAQDHLKTLCATFAAYRAAQEERSVSINEMALGA